MTSSGGTDSQTPVRGMIIQLGLGGAIVGDMPTWVKRRGDKTDTLDSLSEADVIDARQS